MPGRGRGATRAAAKRGLELRVRGRFELEQVDRHPQRDPVVLGPLDRLPGEEQHDRDHQQRQEVLDEIEDRVRPARRPRAALCCAFCAVLSNATVVTFSALVPSRFGSMPAAARMFGCQIVEMSAGLHDRAVEQHRHREALHRAGRDVGVGRRRSRPRCCRWSTSSSSPSSAWSCRSRPRSGRPVPTPSCPFVARPARSVQRLAGVVLR